MTDPLFYTALPLDRASHLRRDDETLTHLRAAPDRRVVPLWREQSLVTDGPAAAVLTGTQAALALDLADEVVFLGLAADGVPVFAADLSPVEDADGLHFPGRWVPLRTTAPVLGGPDGSLLGYARGVLLSLRSLRFCGRCGGPTRAIEGGHGRECLDAHCGARAYPRTDPAVIMLVEDGDRVLLHRQPAWPPGMWSILAGFVEPGETLEDAVAREVVEETGIRVADIAYAGGQPWPFPSSLMLGFTARAIGGTLVPCPHELEDAHWYSRAEIRSLFDDRHRDTGEGLYLAHRGTIARKLIEAWRVC